MYAVCVLCACVCICVYECVLLYIGFVFEQFSAPCITELLKFY